MTPSLLSSLGELLPTRPQPRRCPMCQRPVADAEKRIAIRGMVFHYGCATHRVRGTSRSAR